MAGQGGGYTITPALANKLRQEGRDWFKNRDGEVFTLRTCNRCGGSGQYSFCQMYGTTCFGCKGATVIAIKGAPEAVQAAEEKRTRQRERARERRQEKAVAAEVARQAEDDRLAALLGLATLPLRRGRITVMAVRYADTCHYCTGEIAVDEEAALGDFRGVYHPSCFADVLLNDIEDARPWEHADSQDLPF